MYLAGGAFLLNSHSFWGKSDGSVSSRRGPSAGLPTEAPVAAPRSRSRAPEAVPYLEGLASSLCGSFDEGPDSGTSSSADCDAADDTSNSSSVVSWGWEAEGTSRSPLRACPGLLPKLPEKG